MKKLLLIFAAVAVIAFAGCGTGLDDDSKAKGEAVSGNVVLDVRSVVFVADDDFTALTSATSVKDYMDALANNGELVFDGSDGEYGFYIESVYNTKAEGNAYWAVYTDLVTIEGDDAVYSNAEYGTFTYGNKTLNSASYGVSGLPCVDGYTYALVYTTF